MSLKVSAVKQLTKYISPKEIANLRYKKYNKPKTEFDGIDEFFRQDELFVKEKDNVTCGYRTYDVEDLPLYYSDQVEKDLVHFNSQMRPFIESGHVHPYIKLIKDGKIIDNDFLGRKAKNYYVNYLIDEKLAEGFDTEEICNILYSARTNGVIRLDFAREAFNMMKEGYPINMVVDLMEKSKLKFYNGVSKYSNGMLDFLKKFPHLKNIMITKDFMGDEAFDKTGAKLFSKIYDAAPDEKTALKILIDCRTTEKDGSRYTQPSLVELAVEILKKTGNYSDSAANLVRSIKYTDDYINYKVYAALKRFREGQSLDYIAALLEAEKL